MEAHVEFKETIKAFDQSILKLRMELQESRLLTEVEYLLLKSHLDALMSDLLLKRAPKPSNGQQHTS
jgi:hypothetical protein